eukprot:3351438-Amphidinium_carterae.1
MSLGGGQLSGAGRHQRWRCWKEDQIAGEVADQETCELAEIRESCYYGCPSGLAELDGSGTRSTNASEVAVEILSTCKAMAHARNCILITKQSVGTGCNAGAVVHTRFKESATPPSLLLHA